MKSPTLLAAMLSLSLVLPAQAEEAADIKVANMKVAPSLDVGGKTLKLNGAGVKRNFVFKIYTAAVYAEAPSGDSAQLVASDQIKRVELTVLRNLHKNAIVSALRDGFERNSEPLLPKLKTRFNEIAAAIPVELRTSDRLTFTYEPGKGTSLTINSGGKPVTVEGKDFADALFSVWLGGDPIDPNLKQDLLTRR